MSKKHNKSSLPTPPEDHRDIQSTQDNNQRSILTLEHHYRGPLPPPEILQKYDTVLPGAAERIIAMAERQAAHRQQMEKEVVQGEIADKEADRQEAHRGQLFGLVIALVAFSCGTALVIMGHAKAGTAIATSVILGLVSVFVFGRLHRSKVLNGKESSSEDLSQEMDKDSS